MDEEWKADIKEMKADIKEIKGTLARNTTSLEVHELRTTLAEKRIERFENGAKWVLGLIASGVFGLLARLLSQ